MPSALDRRPPFDAVLGVLSRADPEGLLARGLPPDEYEPEAADLAGRLRAGQPITGDVVLEVWQRWFGPGSRYMRVTSVREVARLASQLDLLR